MFWQLWLLLAAGGLVLSGYIIYKLNAFNLAYFVLAFTLPLSVEFEIFKGINLLFPSEPLAIALTFALGIKGIFEKREFKVSVLLIPSALLICALLITSLTSSNFGVSLKYSMVYILYIVCFYWGVFTNYKDSKSRINLVLSGYTFSYIITTIWAIYKWSWFDFNPVTVPAIFEPFYADHTIFSASGAFLFIYWLVRGFKAKNFKQKLVSISSVIIILVALRIANSRAALLSLPVGLLVGFLVYKGITKRHLALSGLIVFAGLFLSRNAIYDWVSYNDYNSRDQHASFVERTASVGNVQTDVSNLERINRWTAALNMAKEKPLTGFGPGTYQFAYIPYQDEKWMNRLSVIDIYDIPNNSGGTVHSEPLLYLSESGLFGFLTWLVLVSSWIWWVVSIDKKRRNIYLAVAIAMVTTYLFHGFFNNFLNTDKLAFLFWGAAAVMMIEIQNENPNKYILQFGR
jgi:O-antigen ligase